MKFSKLLLGLCFVFCFLLVLHIEKIVENSDKRIKLITWITFNFILKLFNNLLNDRKQESSLTYALQNHS